MTESDTTLYWYIGIRYLFYTERSRDESTTVLMYMGARDP